MRTVGARCRYVVPVRAIRRFTVRPVLPDALKPLADLASNLRWCWHHDTQALFASVDADLWQSTGQDPVKLLAEVSVERLTKLSKDRKFVRSLEIAQADLDRKSVV